MCDGQLHLGPLHNLSERRLLCPLQGGHVATVRDSRGDDKMAACGQLGSPESSSRRPPLLAPPESMQGVLAAAP